MNAPLPSWVLAQYQPAAEHACREMGQDPYQVVALTPGDLTGNYYAMPNWMIMATKMHELSVMLKAARQYGIAL